MGGDRPLGSEKIESWCRLEGVALTPFELRAVRNLDGLFTSKQYEQGAGEDVD